MTELTTAPSGAPLADGDILLVRKDGAAGVKKITAVEAKAYFAEGGGASYPAFVGNAGKVLAVNVDEDGVEWVVASEGGGSSSAQIEIGAHRFWGIRLPISTVSGIASIATLSFHAVVGGAGLIGTAYSTTGVAPNDATAAFDTNPNTYWRAGAVSVQHAIWLDLGAGNTSKVVEVSVTSRADAAANETPYMFEVIYSDDGDDWRISHAIKLAPFLSTELGVTKTAQLSTTETITGGAGSGKPWFHNPPLLSSFPDIFGTTLPVVSNDADVGLILQSAVQGVFPRGVGRPTPAGSWIATTRFESGMIGGGVRYANAALVTYNAAKNKFFTWGLDSRNIVHLTRCTATAYDGFEALFSIGSRAPNWFRYEYNATLGILTYSVSYDGKSWVPLGTRDVKTDMSNADPAFVGLALTNENYTYNNTMAVQAWTVNAV